MDNVNQIRSVIEQTLLALTRIADSIDPIQYQTIFDRINDHYLLVQVGWGNQQRIYGTVGHIDLVGTMVWVQMDGTEEGLAEQLRQAGIPADQIVLGYRLPEVRKHTEFAIA